MIETGVSPFNEHFCSLGNNLSLVTPTRMEPLKRLPFTTANPSASVFDSFSSSSMGTDAADCEPRSLLSPDSICPSEGHRVAMKTRRKYLFFWLRLLQSRRPQYRKRKHHIGHLGTLRPAPSVQGGCGGGLSPSGLSVATSCTAITYGCNGSWKHHVMTKSALKHTRSCCGPWLRLVVCKPCMSCTFRLFVIYLCRVARGWDFFTASLFA